MRRVISIGLCILLFLIFPLYLIKAKDYKEEDLLKEGDKIEKEIDKLLEEIKTLPKPKPVSQEIPSAFVTQVITPVEIAQTLIPASKRNKKITLNFDKAKLEDVLRTIGEAVGINILLDPALKGKKVDLHLKNIPIEEALSLLYNAYDLGSYRVGNSLYVSSKEKIKRQTLVTKMIKLKNLSAKEAEGLIKDLVETINVSEETNTLVIVGNPEDISKVEKILKKADIPQPQVILEAKVIEINRDALKELGIDWSDALTFNFQESRRPTSLDSEETSLGGPFRVYRLARTALQFETIIKMLENENKAKVLSSPHVSTLNNKEAEIFVGDKVPYTVTLVSGGTTTTEVRFIDAGIRLKITPSIIEKDFVVIKVEPEVSYIYAWRGPQDQYPWVKTRQATAYVRVKNGQPFVLGGLLNKEDKKNLYKVPLFSDIPWLGNLFRYEKHTVYDSELIITVTPTIVSGEL